MVMHFSMLVIEQMWSELSRMEGEKKEEIHLRTVTLQTPVQG